MKKILLLLCLVLCCSMLFGSVSAESIVSNLDGQWVVNENGQCTVSVTVNLTLTQPDSDPQFPIPAEATDVSLNGQKLTPATSGSIRQIPLRSITGGNAGDFTFTLHYTLPGVVEPVEGGMELELILLSGFAYPVENMTFTVILPAPATEQPVFTSSYYQEQIQSQMTLATEADTINGSTGPLKDHESLSMKLAVTEAMFPQPSVTARVMDVMDIAVLACVVLALIYYIITMLPPFIRWGTRTTAPDGVCPGDLQMWLTGRGIDLSLLVVTWAQLGYLRIQMDDGGRVILHKRMDMGNERSIFENRAFRNLFGARRIIDGTGYHYAQLCRSMWSQSPGIRDIYLRRSGNPYIFRGICAIAGMLSGVIVAGAYLPHSLFLKIFLGIVGIIFALVLQSAGARIPRRQKAIMPIAGVCTVVWILTSAFCGELVPSIFMVLFQFAAGLAAAYGGKRTALGYEAMTQIFELRHHLRSVSRDELLRLLSGNEDYFYQMAPYALALDLDQTFARRFSGLELPECSYLIIGNRRQMSPTEWARHLRLCVQILDHKANRLPLDRLTGR